MKRNFGLLLPVLIALAGLAAFFSLPARELQPAQAAGNLPQIAEVNVTTQQGEIQDSALQLDAPRLQFSPENLEVNLWLIGIYRD